MATRQPGLANHHSVEGGPLVLLELLDDVAGGLAGSPLAWTMCVLVRPSHQCSLAECTGKLGNCLCAKQQSSRSAYVNKPWKTVHKMPKE